jgi:hypothetical protein
MSEVALISELTWRTLDRQKAAYPAIPHFIAPDDLPTMLRPTRRNEELKVHVMSLAVIADKDADFREFLKAAKKRKVVLHIWESNSVIVSWACDIEGVVRSWRDARRTGAGKAGGVISAVLREAESRKACEAIRPLWPLPSNEHSTPDLLKMAGKAIGKKKLAYNTAIKFLGKRPIAQYNYQAKLKRKANAKR